MKQVDASLSVCEISARTEKSPAPQDIDVSIRQSWRSVNSKEDENREELLILFTFSALSHVFNAELVSRASVDRG